MVEGVVTAAVALETAAVEEAATDQPATSTGLTGRKRGRPQKDATTTTALDGITASLSHKIVQPVVTAQGRAVVDFFFNVRCACKHSKRYCHCLSITGATFAIPTYYLFWKRLYMMCFFSSILTITTILYHYTHDSRIRAVDVFAGWLNGCFGLAQCLMGIVLDGPNIYLALVLLGIALSNVINMSSYFLDKNGCFALHWHAALHFLTAQSLTCLALGMTKTE